MDELRVSVVIPAYNEEKYIGKTLQSLINQEEKADEIIVVDNNSTDRTVEICKQFSAVSVIYEPRKGITRARNAGFDTARFDLIVRCDADTIVLRDWIKKIKEKFRQNQIDGLSGPIIYYDLPFKTTRWAKAYIHFIRKWKKHITLIGSNMAITKKMWEELKNELCVDDKRVHEDVDLAWHAHKKGKVIFYDPKLIVFPSSRRIRKKPHSFFIEYPIRLFRTFHKYPN